uniref:Chitinase 1 n=1 Tax=Monodon monoceros TaxID=40151 RepID=A0A8C6AQA3_MONMO
CPWWEPSLLDKPPSGRRGSAAKLVCYFTNWAQYRQGAARFLPKDVDPKLCTHLIYAFAGMNNHQLSSVAWNAETLYKEFNSLKKMNPKLKTLLATGGWNFGTQKFVDMVAIANNRQTFVNPAIRFLCKYGVDGLDLDWEYTGSRGSPPSDKQCFIALGQDLANAFQQEAQASGKAHLLPSTAVPAGPHCTKPLTLSSHASCRNLEFLSFMAYDFHGSWEKNTGHNRPRPPTRDRERDSAMQWWLQKGTPASKLILVGAQATGPGTPGPFTKDGGLLAYYEVGKPTHRIKDQKVPYAFQSSQWVGFDDVESFKVKVSYLKQTGLGGVMVWTLNMDDFAGFFCNQGQYPLIKILHCETPLALTITWLGFADGR